MEINLKDLKELLCLENDYQSFLEVGKNYQIRTVTMIYTGKLKKENKESLLLGDAAWIPDTGRFSDSMKNTDLYNEVEPYHRPPIIFKSGIVDVVEIDKLPRIQK